MNQIYSPERVRALREKARRVVIAAGMIGAAALVVCVLLCLGIRTANAALRQGLVICLTGLGAGAAVWLLEGIRLPALREAAHEEGVLREAPEAHQGQIVRIDPAHPIPRSITFLPVTLREGERELSFKLNAVCATRFPAQGSWIRAEVRRGYLVSWEEIAGEAAAEADFAPAAGQAGEQPRAAEKEGDGRASRTRTEDNPARGKERWTRPPVGRLIRHALLCLAAGALLWSWIFTFLTDTDPAHKIVLYAGLREGEWQALSIRLEEDAPEGIRFVQAHPFSYALMDSAALEQADLYIMTAAQAEEYRAWLAPLPEPFREEETLADKEGMLMGRRIYDGAAGEGAAGEYLRYAEEPGADWYLFFGAQSLHMGEQDDAAIRIAELLLRLR